MEKLIGGLERCRCENCNNITYFEDSPTAYPFCEEHKEMNKSYIQWKQEKKEFDEKVEELYQNNK